MNGKYIYYNTSDGKIHSADDIPSEDEQKPYYLWKLRNRDPYFMLIDNLGARVAMGVSGDESVTVYDDNGGSVTASRQKGAWLKLTEGTLENEKDVEFITTRNDAQHFIAKSSLNQGIYEVMVATGDGDIDAGTTYYNIGLPGDPLKIYDNNVKTGGYAHGSPVLAFNLDQTIVYTYYLIDKAKHKLLEIESKNPDLVLPAEYQSPLATSYHYYSSDNITITHTANGDEYTPTDPETQIDNLEAAYTKTLGDYASEWEAADAAHKKSSKDVDDLDTQAKQLKTIGNYYFQKCIYFH